MSKLQMQELEEEQQQEPNWTLMIVGYFAILAVVIVLLRPLHMSMGGIFFSMVIAGLALALIIFLIKRGIHKVAAMNITAKEAYHLAIGYIPGQGLEMEDEDESDPYQEPATFIAERDPLNLGERFKPSFHAFLCVMCLIVGIRRSGKSTLLLTLVEELASYGLPFVLFDTMGEYNGLVSRQYLLRPRLGGNVERLSDIPDAAKPFLAHLTTENAYRCGQMVMDHALQLVVNLKGYNDDDAAIIMAEIVDGVNDWQEARHNSERIPFMFFLDEAQKWFPQNRQDKATDINIETQNVPKALSQGECIAFGPDVTHFTFQARKASVPHEGHTPNAAALAKYTRNLDVESIHKVYPFPGTPDEPRPTRPVAPTLPALEEQTVERSNRPRSLPAHLQQALDKYREGYASSRKLAPAIGVKKSRAADLIKQLRDAGYIEATNGNEAEDEESTDE